MLDGTLTYTFLFQVTGLGTPDFNELLNVVTDRALSEHLHNGAAHGPWAPGIIYTFLWALGAGVLCRTIMY